MPSSPMRPANRLYPPHLPDLHHHHHHHHHRILTKTSPTDSRTDPSFQSLEQLWLLHLLQSF
uniref:Non-specific lipid-transfer protein n=1 Tax=Solanum tuberosum TaxID=4113 RepID=M1D7X4_SOLTU